MFFVRLSTLVLVLGFALNGVSASDSSREDGFRWPERLPPHPRIFLTREREHELKEMLKTDEFLKRQVDALLAKAERILDEPTTRYEIPDGKRLLTASRRSLERTSTFSFAFRMTGEKKYADAATAEMLAVCRFENWNPKHYLDTAEMATAVGIGYDWLYDVIPAGQRDEIRAALVGHALKTGLPIYEKKRGWSQGHNNWNEVCNAGLTVGALAVADEEPELAEKIVRYAVASLPNGLGAYKPDGAYPEGPMYWSYGSTFTGVMIMALRDVFRSDFGLLKAEGLDVTGDYYMGMCGPLYRSFNYADGVDTVDATPMMYALARCFDRPDYARWLRNFVRDQKRFDRGRFAVFHAVWYDPRGADGDVATPRAKMYRGIQDVATMRTAWEDPQAAFLGFKGGNNRASHGHLDIGSFVYDVDGVRWAVDLGTDNYNLPGYFGKQRWEYFRLNNRSHNTLVIDDKLQNPAAQCSIVRFERDSGDFVARATVDMTPAYESQVRSAKRTATLFNDGAMTIEDLLDGVGEPVRWGMMTSARIELDGKTAILSTKGKKVRVEIVSEEVERWEIVAATPPTEQERQNKGFAILAAKATPRNEKVSIRVEFRTESRAGSEPAASR